MSNKLSMADVYTFCTVTMDSKVKTAIYVYRQDGLVVELKQFKLRLYYFDLAEHIKSNTSSEIIYNYLPSYSFIRTVEENKIRYT